MLENRRRIVKYFELRIDQKPNNAPEIEMLELYETLSSLGISELIKPIKKDSAAICLADHHHYMSVESISLLFCLSDSNYTDPAFMNMLTSAVRIEEKEEDEGIGFSCHVTISLIKNSNNGYLLVMEHVPGLTIHRVVSFLNMMVCKKYENFFQDGSVMEKKYKRTIKYTEYPNEKLIEALTTGELKGIELLDFEESEESLDELSLSKKSVSTLKVKQISNLNTVEKAIEGLRKVWGHGIEKNYSSVRIRVKPHNSAITSVDFDLLNDSIEDSEFVKSKELNFSYNLDQCYIKRELRICRKLNQIIREERADE